MTRQKYMENFSRKYIRDIVRLLGKISDFDTDKNKIIKSDVFDHLRIHYMRIFAIMIILEI